MAEKKNAAAKNVKARKTSLAKPKKLSKAGEWALAHPNGLDIEYINWKAVLR